MAAKSTERMKIQEQADKLKRQNEVLKSQLELRKENADLKTANILAQILGMLEKIGSGSDVNLVSASAPSSSEQVPEMSSVTAAKVADATMASARTPPTPRVKLTFSDEQPSSSCRSDFSPKDYTAKAGCACPRDISLGYVPCQTRECSVSTPPAPRARKPDPSTSYRGPMQASDLASQVAGPGGGGRPKSAYLDMQSTPSSYSDGPPVLRSIGLSSVGEDSYLGKEENSPNMSADNVLPITPRLIGEIAFQLDRRLLSYIFNGHANSANIRRRFYGFTIQNIEEMIDIESNKNGAHDEQTRMAMSYRYQYIFNRMKMLGYDLKYHPLFSCRMVNTFGLLNVSGQGMGQSLQLQDPDILQAILGKIAPKECLKDVLILLDCLVFLSHDEGKPLFIY